MKKSLFTKIAAALLACTTLGAVLPFGASASGSSDPLVVVSLGDSYSSGRLFSDRSGDGACDQERDAGTGDTGEQ